MNGKDENCGRLRSITSACIITLTVGVLLKLFWDKAVYVLVPLGTAWLISSAVRPLARYVSRKSRTSVKVCGGVLIALAVFALIYASVCLGGKLLRELTELLSGAVADLEGDDNVIRRLMDYVYSLPKRFPVLSSLSRKMDNAFSEELYSFTLTAAREVVSRLSSSATSFAAGFIKGMPRFVFSVVVCIASLFYLTVDYDGVKNGIRQIVSDNTYEKLRGMYGDIAVGVGGYVRAYFVLMAMTFGELLLAFTILRIRYAFFLALFISAVDILPLLGAGTVILPWAGLLFIMGDSKKAVGLIILLGIMYVVRQFTEPRLVGKFMGIHPLLTLSAAFIGFCFLGFGGMIISPVVLYVVKLSVSNGEGSHKS